MACQAHLEGGVSKQLANSEDYDCFQDLRLTVCAAVAPGVWLGEEYCADT